jgi:hypothetical protein
VIFITCRTENRGASAVSRASQIGERVLYVNARVASAPRARQNVGNSRRVAHRVGHSFIGHEIVAVKDLHRQNATVWRDPC